MPNLNHKLFLIIWTFPSYWLFSFSLGELHWLPMLSNGDFTQTIFCWLLKCRERAIRHQWRVSGVLDLAFFIVMKHITFNELYLFPTANSFKSHLQSSFCLAQPFFDNNKVLIPQRFQWPVLKLFIYVNIIVDKFIKTSLYLPNLLLAAYQHKIKK